MKYRLLSLANDIWYLYARLFFSYVMYFLAKVAYACGVKDKAISLCMMSARYGESSRAIVFLKKIMEVPQLIDKKVSVGVGEGEASARSIVIKWPVFVGEEKIDKGVIVITFTRTFSYFLRNMNLEKMGKYFTFVLEPSWSGYADPDILGFCGKLNNVLIQASAIEDRVLLNCFSETFVPVSFGASDWVDTNIFKNTNSNKIYDSIYIANTNPIKRVKRYLDAINTIVKKGNVDYVGCLVCASWGGAEKLIAKLVESYNLKNNVVLKFSLSREQVIESLNQSKVNILLSFKEGSNRSMFESMFCDVPVICLSENVGVNKSYINEFTGLLVPDQLLEGALLWIRDNNTLFNPRKWAVENISPIVTTEKLKNILKNRKVIQGLDASEAIYIKTNNPEVSYFDFQHIVHSVYTKEVLGLFVKDKNSDDVELKSAINALYDRFEKEVSSAGNINH